MTDRELMQQALEALERCVATCFDQYAHEQVMSRPEHFVNQNITALRERLAQPEQEPVACQYAKDVAMPEYRCAGKCQYAQPEQEPVAHTTGHCENHKQKGGCQLHNLQCGWPDCDRKPITAPPQPEQEPTGCSCRWDSEGDRVVTCARHEGWLEVIAEWADRARDAEKKLKALNTSPPPPPCPTCEALARTVMLDQTSHDTQRKPLTDEEISDLWCKVSNTDFVTADTHVFARAVEAAHGIGEKPDAA